MVWTVDSDVAAICHKLISCYQTGLHDRYKGTEEA